MTATKIQPGDDMHLTSLMAPHSLNLVTGADRAALLAYGRDVFAAARDSKCLAQIEEPAQPALYVSPGQLANHSDPEGPESAKAGRYLPARKTPAGKFTMPLYAGAATAAVAGPAPAGWQLVPATPTREWIASVADGGYEDCDCASLIADILSRAPAAPALEAPAAPASEREAFEAWFSAAHHDRLDRNMPDKSYNSPGAECAWGAWQARAALAAAPQAPAAPRVVFADWEMEDRDPVEMLDKIYAVYQRSMGKPAPDAEMAEVVELTKDMLLAWWGEHREDIRAAMVAAQDEAAPAAPAVDAWLQPDDMAALQRFHETAEDDESYDIGKEAVARLCAFGCLQSHSFGRYSTTDFGDYLLDTWGGARTLPFTTAAERSDRAAQAAAKGASDD